jgi:hypothetical protein
LCYYLAAGASTAAADTRANTLEFIVHVSDAPSGPVKDVSAVLVGRHGTQELGKTDPGGVIRVRKGQIREQAGIAILFCLDDSGLACSAVRVSDRLLGFDEFPIMIALPRMIDRLPVR